MIALARALVGFFSVDAVLLTPVAVVGLALRLGPLSRPRPARGRHRAGRRSDGA